MTWRGFLLVFSCAAVFTARSAAAQTPTQTTTPPPTAASPQSTAPTPPPLPVNVEKIREALDHPQTINLNGRNLFIVEIHPPPISFMALVGDYDLMKGPAPGAPTSRDLTNLMTPREMYGSAGITATDLLQFAATSFAAQALVRKAVQEIRQAHDQKEVAAIRARIDRELAALMANEKDK